MLSNAYFLANVRFDTAENEPAKNQQNVAKNIYKLQIMLPILLILLTLTPILSQRNIYGGRCARGRAPGGGPPRRRAPRARAAGAGLRSGPGGQQPIFSKISAKFSSFSAVSAPIFASKYTFYSIFKIYQIIQLNFLKFRKFLQHLQNVAEFSRKLLICQTNFLLKF